MRANQGSRSLFQGHCHTDLEDDSDIISSRDTGNLSSCHRQPQLQGRAKTVAAHAFESVSGLGSGSDASAFSAKYPEGPSAIFGEAKAVDLPNSSERNNEWLRDQSSRTIKGVARLPKSVSAESSINLSEDSEPANPFESPFNGDLVA
jgi:hypothetical protein